MQANIIPYYAQHLPRSRRIDLYSKFLQTVEKKDERTKCLEEATRFFAEDIPDILQTTAQLSREHPPEAIGQRIDLDPSKVPEGAYHDVLGGGGGGVDLRPGRVTIQRHVACCVWRGVCGGVVF